MSLDVKAIVKPSVLSIRSGVRPTAIHPERRSVISHEQGTPEPQAKTALANRKPDAYGLLAKVDVFA